MPLQDHNWSEDQLLSLDQIMINTDLHRELLKRLWPRKQRCVHRDFCHFRQALLSPIPPLRPPGREHPYPKASEFAWKWIRGKTGGRDVQRRFKEDTKAFADVSVRRGRKRQILEGDWTGPAEGPTDAITGAILDGCLDCLHCMEVLGLLPGGIEGGPVEYNGTGYALISIALAGEISVMQDDFKDSDLDPYRKVLRFLIARQKDEDHLGPLIASTIHADGERGDPVLQLALESKVSTGTLEILAKWYSEYPNNKEGIQDILRDSNLGFELCCRANKFLLAWARDESDINLADAYGTGPEGGTAWHALCQNPLGDTLLGDFSSSKWKPGEPAEGRIPLCDAIIKDRPDLVEWFLKPEQQPQNTWTRYKDHKNRERPSAIEVAMEHNKPEAARCLYLMIQAPNHQRIMRNSIGGVNRYCARLVLQLITDFIQTERSKRSKAQEVDISPDIIKLDIHRLKYITLLKFKAILHGTSDKWIRTPDGQELEDLCADNPSCEFLRSFSWQPCIRFDGATNTN